MANEEDALDGFRGRPANASEEEAQAQEYLDHSNSHEYNPMIDMALVREVLNSDALLVAMKDDTALAMLVTYATGRLDTCSKVWQISPDPTSKEVLIAHREARAARLLIDWIEHVLKNGEIAEQQINEADRENGYD